MVSGDFSEVDQRCSLPTLWDNRVIKFVMIPMSTSCTGDVALGGRNSNCTFFKESKWECAAHLLRTSGLFLDFDCHSMSQLISCFLNISGVVHTFLLALYRTGKPFIWIPLKHQGLALFPVTNSFHLSVPDMSKKHNSHTVHCFLWTR
jgi:hypothetical protein